MMSSFITMGYILYGYWLIQKSLHVFKNFTDTMK